MARIRIGVSGWLYKHWRGGAFYPRGLRQRDEFAYYASRFDTVEINGSFYRVPVEGAPERWREQAPPDFLYAWKYPRWLTHYYRLRDPAESYRLVFGRMRALGRSEGPVLFQLHPRVTADRERLARALKLMPAGKRAAFEFRHPSWYEPAVLALLAEHDASLCISDHHDAPAPWGNDRELGLCPRPRARRALLRPLCAFDARSVGQTHARLAPGRQGRILLFRQ